MSKASRTTKTAAAQFELGGENRAGIIMCKETLLQITSLRMLSHARAGGGDLSGMAWPSSRHRLNGVATYAGI